MLWLLQKQLCKSIKFISLLKCSAELSVIIVSQYEWIRHLWAKLSEVFLTLLFLMIVMMQFLYWCENKCFIFFRKYILCFLVNMAVTLWLTQSEMHNNFIFYAYCNFLSLKFLWTQKSCVLNHKEFLNISILFLCTL